MKNKYSTFKEVDSETLAKNEVRSIYKVAVNDAYIVQFSKTKAGMLECDDIIIDHLWIRTRDYTGKDLTWAEKYRIKEEFFPGRWASEMYPPKEFLTDQANIYHLYVYPELYSFTPGLHLFDLEINKEEVTG